MSPKHVLLLLFISFHVSAQSFYRFKADVTIKDKLADGSFRLTIGQVYYDKIYKKIVYKLQFPKKETIVVQDTTMFIINDKNIIVGSSRTVLIPEFTAFHLALTHQLSDYGLKPKGSEKAIYKIAKVEKVEQGILTTWQPSEPHFKKLFGDIRMLSVNKKLDAMIFYHPKGRMVSKQFFKKYSNMKGVEFPSEVTMISYGEKGEQNIQLTSYKNIQIDQNNEDEMYRYKLPITRSAATKK